MSNRAAPVVARFRHRPAVLRRAGLVIAAVWSWAYRSISPPSSSATLVDTAVGPLLMPLGDVFVARRAGGTAGHDPAVLAAAMAATRPGDDVIVVGAHVGVHAVPLAAAGRRVAVVEANPDTYRLLTLNAAINGVTFVGSVNAPAGATDRPVRFLSSRANSGGSKVRPERMMFEYRYDRPTESDVPGIVLDEWAPVGEMANPFVVMDVEGSELDALRGLVGVLGRCSGLVLEIAPFAISAPDDLQRLLADHFTHGRNVADPDDAYRPAAVVAEVRRRWGDVVSVDVLFERRVTGLPDAGSPHRRR